MKEIYERRSVRKFQNVEVEKEKLLKMIKAGMNGPRAKGLRVASFIVIQDQSLIQSMNEVKHNYLPPAMIAIIGEPEMSAYLEQDLGACTQNMMLMATSMGLGTCWLGIHHNEVVEEKINRLLQIPSNQTVFALLSIGYSDEKLENNDYFDESMIQYR